ncbi:tRNA (adenosine(37)-N6)-threonylcarbamoyltransferase complex ATPase subunit type 1 TsaE [Patescibacteria group bacterium]|nr:tRNA (adenosine(37)-N6)-threonylcarbamoyltransferase complex ATPase subunit type 1 TsaE [Patescibacteria group bacterium]MBU1672826.1 tRNA (adenosine(37)-N6)-threonylcarbamoyltransferase complex ATPase subunit type 1 TsaE [Patescibacteria group bacterium]MBU1963465.1 tRNA (adenosine(37)-N6)-threonylcarbamoyltransferase complex ATPase subunit type 1 TsaE [Patescibacteria group bacterium]
MKKDICQSKSAKETMACAAKLGEQLKGGELIALWGDLGSGKTTFIKGLAKSLGVKDAIRSPSFLLFKPYKNFVHADLYRLEKMINLDELGLGEYMEDKNTIVAIEWPEKIKKYLPRKRTDIYFKTIGENEREIKIVRN